MCCLRKEITPPDLVFAVLLQINSPQIPDPFHLLLPPCPTHGVAKNVERYSVKPDPHVRASRPPTQSVASKWPFPPHIPHVTATLQLQSHGMLLPVLSIQTVSLTSCVLPDENHVASDSVRLHRGPYPSNAKTDRNKRNEELLCSRSTAAPSHSNVNLPITARNLRSFSVYVTDQF